VRGGENPATVWRKCAGGHRLRMSHQLR
jgi:hypothetical protein